MSLPIEMTVLVEKPLGQSIAEVDHHRELLSSVTERILVGYVLRHNETMQATANILAEGVLGQVTSAQAMLGSYQTIALAQSRFAAPQADRLVRDYSHEWDYLRWFFGPATRTMATSRTVDAEVVETPNVVDGMLEFSTGVCAAFHLDYVDTRGTRTLHIIGDSGSLLTDVDDGSVSIKTAGDKATRTLRFSNEPATALRAQAKHLIAVASEAVAPKVTLSDGLGALAIAEAVSDSAANDALGWVVITKPELESIT